MVEFKEYNELDISEVVNGIISEFEYVKYMTNINILNGEYNKDFDELNICVHFADIVADNIVDFEATQEYECCELLYNLGIDILTNYTTDKGAEKLIIDCINDIKKDRNEL